MAIITDAQLIAHLAPETFSASKITGAVNGVNTEIENFCNRTFDATDYIKWMNGKGGKNLVLTEYPLINITRLADSGLITALISNTGTSYTVMITTAGTAILSVLGQASDTLTLSDYATMALFATAIGALGKGWTMTVSIEDAPAHLRPMASTGANGTNIELESPDNDIEVIITDEANSVLYNPWGWPRGIANLFVVYRAGYEAGTIPGDLTRIALSFATDILHSDASDTTKKSEKLGDYSYANVDRTASGTGVGGGSGGLLAPYMDALSFYRRRLV